MGRYINFHSHFNDPDAQITLVNSNPGKFNPEKGIYYSCGIHPWDVKDEMTEELKSLENLLGSHHEILAVGECGLDFHRNPESRKFQENVFIKQLELAEKFHRPVILHVVKAENTIREIIKRSGVKISCVVHGFNKRETVAREWIRNGFYLSVGASVLEKNTSLIQAIKTIPADRLFLETDNSEVSVKELYKAATDILGCREEALIDQIEINFEKLFQG